MRSYPSPVLPLLIAALAPAVTRGQNVTSSTTQKRYSHAAEEKQRHLLLLSEIYDSNNNPDDTGRGNGFTPDTSTSTAEDNPGKPGSQLWDFLVETTNTSTRLIFDDDVDNGLTCNSSSVDGSTATLSTSEFHAQVEFTLEGRNDLLGRLERTALEGIFLTSYNYILATQQGSCDLYNFRLTQMSFLQMSNPLGDLVTTTLSTISGTDSDDLFGIPDPFRPSTQGDSGIPPPTLLPGVEDIPLPAPPIDDLADTIVDDLLFPGNRRNLQSSSERPECVEDDTRPCDDQVTVVYNVTGTCRNCPILESGTFPLFDDDLRHRELSSLRLRVRVFPDIATTTATTTVTRGQRDDSITSSRHLQDITSPPLNSIIDAECVCTATGLPPTIFPQLPRITEFLLDINTRLVKLRDDLVQDDSEDGSGLGGILFRNISRIENVRQLDMTTNGINNPAVDVSRNHEKRLDDNLPPIDKALSSKTATAKEEYDNESSPVVHFEEQQEAVSAAATVSPAASRLRGSFPVALFAIGHYMIGVGLAL